MVEGRNILTLPLFAPSNPSQHLPLAKAVPEQKVRKCENRGVQKKERERQTAQPSPNI